MKSLALVSLFTLTAASAQTPEPPVRDLLRDGLYAEEVCNDPAAAAKDYEKILATFEEQRPFAANALYRLAELRRKDGKNDEAIALYQRVLSQFPDVTPQATLAKTQLAALGVKPAEINGSATPGPPPDPENEELQRLESFLTTSPDLLSKADPYLFSIRRGWVRPIEFLVKHRARLNPGLPVMLLREAVEEGHLQIVKTLLAGGIDTKSKEARESLDHACAFGFAEIAQALLDAGVDPNSDASFALFEAVENNHIKIVELLLNRGANPNFVSRTSSRITDISPIGTPLLLAIGRGSSEIIDLLIAHKAEVNMADPHSGITPLWMAAGKSAGAPLVKQLLALNADPRVKSLPTPPLNDWPFYPGPTTPLDSAVLTGSPETVKLLIAAMKKRNQRWKPTIPTRIFEFGSKNLPSAETLRLLFEAGATPGPGLVRKAAFINSSGKGDVRPLIGELLDHGAPVDPAWIDSDFGRTSWSEDTGPVFQFLLRRLRYPQWSGETAIHIVDIFGKVTVVSRKAGAKTPPSVKELITRNERVGNYLLYRKGDDGKKSVRTIPPEEANDQTQLQWGDIIELQPPE